MIIKKPILPFYQSVFSNTLISSALIGMLFMQPVTAMPSVSGFDPLSSFEASPQKLRAFSYIMQHSLVMRVHLENPAQEKVRIQILNNRKKVVYQKYLGKEETFIVKFDLQEMPNGDYTLEVQSPSHTYSRSFSLQTSITREVKLQDNVSDIVKQETI